MVWPLSETKINRNLCTFIEIKITNRITKNKYLRKIGRVIEEESFGCQMRVKHHIFKYAGRVQSA